MLAADFGDAPDLGAGTGVGNYETLAANGGARHTIDGSQTTLFLGTGVDGDSGGLFSTRADSDDRDKSPDDENGVFDVSDLVVTTGSTPTVRVRVTNNTGSTATLSGWIDYDRNGIFDNQTERAERTIASGTTNAITELFFPQVPEGFAGTTYARFRLGTQASAENPTGATGNGEVEDYTARIVGASTADPLSTTEINALTTNGPNLAEDDVFGSSVANIGDFNGDGITDIAVGAIGDEGGSEDEGAVHLHFLNANGSVKQTVELNASTPNMPLVTSFDFFGSSVTSVGDLNGDGNTDLAVGSKGGDIGGSVTILLMNSNGTVNSGNRIDSFDVTLSAEDDFGTSITSLGDLDGDGITDIAVGAARDDGGGANRGTVHILFLNADGSVKQATEINSTSTNAPTLADYDNFGSSVAALGDLDGDGVTDLAVGARQLFTPESRGAVHLLLLNADGSVKRSVTIDGSTPNGPTLSTGDTFGSSVASVGDLNGDGTPDIAVGAKLDDAGGSTRGTVHVLLLNPNGTVIQTTEINSNTANGPNLANEDRFGSSVALLGDLNGDGAPEIAVGADLDDAGAFAAGAVHIISLTSADATAPVLQSITRRHPTGDTTDADSLIFRATFSEGVRQIGPGDFAVNGSTTATVTNVTMVAAGVYDVTVSGGNLANFTGTAGLDLGPQNIVDLAGNALPGTEPSVDQTYDVKRAQVVIDNGDAGYFEFGGGWTNSGLQGAGGSGTRFSTNVGAGVTYRPPQFFGTGWYTVEVFNVANFFNARHVRATIVHAGSTQTMTLNPAVTPNGFTTLGEFYFDGNGSEAVTFVNLGGGVLRADTVHFIPTGGPPDLTIDNDDPGYTENGGWGTSSLGGNGGSDTRFASSPSATAEWSAANLEAGWYTVEFYNVDHPSSTTNAELTIVHAGGVVTRRIDQRATDRGFVVLGRFYFDGNGSEKVVLSNVAKDGVLRADTVRFQLQTPPFERLPPRTETGFDWANSGLKGNEGGVTRFTTNPNDTAIWTPTNIEPGWHQVSFYNVSHPSNTTSARITIVAAGVTRTLTINPRTTPTGFVNLGTFYFDAAGGESITLANATGSGILRADDVRLRTTPPPSGALIQNGDSGYTEAGGGWTSSGLTGLDGSGSRFSTQSTATASWTPPSLAAGWYQVELFNVPHPSNTTSARATIVHAGTSDTRTFNPRITAKGFVPLGTFFFDGRAGELVRLEKLSGGVLRADAVRFRSTPPPAEVVLDNGQPGYTELGSGWSNSGLSGSNGSGTRFTSNPDASARWTFQNLLAGNYVVEFYNVQHPSNTTNARVTVNHSGVSQTRTLDQRATASGFVTLGTFQFNGGGSESITLENLAASGVLRADAIRLRRVAPLQDEPLTPGPSSAGSAPPTVAEMDSLLDYSLGGS